MKIYSYSLQEKVNNELPKRVKDAMDICGWNAFGIYELVKDNLVDESRKENQALRWMLCNSYCKHPYLDDGEMQDNSVSPFIDFKRDSMEVIKQKILERNIANMPTK